MKTQPLHPDRPPSPPSPVWFSLATVLALPLILLAIVVVYRLAGLFGSGPGPATWPLALLSVLTLAGVGAAIWEGLSVVARWLTVLGVLKKGDEPVLWLEQVSWPHLRLPLTERQLAKFTLLTGRPGCGKTTLAVAQFAGRLKLARRRGQSINSIIFDPNRSLAEPAVAWSLALGRRPVVIDLGNPEAVAALVLPRPGAEGVEAAVESFKRTWFSFEGDVPVQMEDGLRHALTLLDVGGFGLEQAVRVLRSPGFRDHLLRIGAGRLPAHVREWVALVESMPPSTWYGKFMSMLARLFWISGSPLRLTLAGRQCGGLDLVELINGKAGAGVDLIITAQRMGGDRVRIAFGYLLSLVCEAVRYRLVASPGRAWPRLLVVADELGAYGAPEALWALIASARNTVVELVGVLHTLALLRPELRVQAAVAAANRFCGGEAGPGAEETANELFVFEAGRPAPAGGIWSAAEQLAAFATRLRHARDREFLTRLDGWERPVWVRLLSGGPGRPLDARLAGWLAARCGRWPRLARGLVRIADSGGPAESLLRADPIIAQAEALRAAAQASGRPPAEIQAVLDRVDADLDRLFGPVGYMPPPAPDDTDDSWRDRPQESFAPF